MAVLNRADGRLVPSMAPGVLAPGFADQVELQQIMSQEYECHSHACPLVLARWPAALAAHWLHVHSSRGSSRQHLPL